MGGRGSGSRMGGGGGAFTSFSDKAEDGWNYEGDGKAQVDFFMNNSNVDELIKGMSPDERKAFRSWASGMFMYGQQYNGWDNMDDDEKRTTQRYDDILDRATLNKGVVLTRASTAELLFGAGNRTASLSQLQAAEGSIVTSKGSMSFGAASEGLAISYRKDSKPIEYKLKIPGGTTGAGMWIGDRRINGWGADQREFMTNRDVAYRVGKTKYDSSRKVYTVELEYAGRMAHDYGTSGRV